MVTVHLTSHDDARSLDMCLLGLHSGGFSLLQGQQGFHVSQQSYCDSRTPCESAEGLQLSRRDGMPWNQHKCRNWSPYYSKGKIVQVKGLCKQWISRAYATSKSLQKLLGHLFYTQMCGTVKSVLNIILQLLRGTPAQGQVSLNASFYKNVNWFTKFLESYNGVTKVHTTDDNYTTL